MSGRGATLESLEAGVTGLTVDEARAARGGALSFHYSYRKGDGDGGSLAVLACAGDRCVGGTVRKVDSGGV